MSEVTLARHGASRPFEPELVVRAVPSLRRSTLTLSRVCFTYWAASASVKTDFPDSSSGRSSGVTVAKLQIPWRSGRPSDKRGGFAAFAEAVLLAAPGAWAATGACTAQTLCEEGGGHDDTLHNGQRSMLHGRFLHSQYS